MFLPRSPTRPNWPASEASRFRPDGRLKFKLDENLPALVGAVFAQQAQPTSPDASCGQRGGGVSTLPRTRCTSQRNASPVSPLRPPTATDGTIGAWSGAGSATANANT